MHACFQAYAGRPTGSRRLAVFAAAIMAPRLSVRLTRPPPQRWLQRLQTLSIHVELPFAAAPTAQLAVPEHALLSASAAQLRN